MPQRLQHEVQASIDDITEPSPARRTAWPSAPRSVMLNRNGYIERFDIPGKRIRGTRLLQPNADP
jgi:ATP-dependent DNA helicase RecQ